MSLKFKDKDGNVKTAITEDQMEGYVTKERFDSVIEELQDIKAKKVKTEDVKVSFPYLILSESSKIDLRKFY